MVKKSRIITLISIITVGCVVIIILAKPVLEPLKPVRIEGGAMEPTLRDGDRVFISGKISELNRGDIVVFYHPLDHKKSFVKRIIGLPGERIELRQGKVIINGQQIEEPYLKAAFFSENALDPIQIPEQHYYVMGDNRRNSSDSRFWGTVPKELIYGKFSWRYWSTK